jgi:hypothetical protein
MNPPQTLFHTGCADEAALRLHRSAICVMRGGLVCLNSELGLDEWISCRVQAATGCGSLSK